MMKNRGPIPILEEKERMVRQVKEDEDFNKPTGFFHINVLVTLAREIFVEWCGHMPYCSGFKNKCEVRR